MVAARAAKRGGQEHRRTAPFSVLFLSCALAACSCPGGGTSPSADQSRQVPLGQAAPSVDSGSAGGTAAQAPGVMSCPSGGLYCADGCCAAGQSCADGGGCTEQSATAACPADAPLACSGAVSCGAGGCVAVDSSGNGRTFVLQSPAGFVPGKFGTGVSTNQTGFTCAVVIEADAGGLPAGNAPETFEFWMRDDVHEAFPGSVGFVFQQGDRILDLNTGGAYTFTWFGAGAPAPIDGSWHFIAATWDGATARLYVDARPVALGSGARATPANSPLILGGSTQNPCYFVSSHFDELRVLTFAADAGQIASDYDAGRLSLIPGTAGLWHFDEGETQRCCPSGTNCDGDAGCAAAPGAATNPVACGDGGFCPGGTSCTPGGCGSGDGGACPASNPVSCGNGLCCPSGATCNATSCTLAGTTPSGNTCPAFAPTAFAISSTQLACCQTFGYPMSAFTGTVSCVGGGSFSGAVCEFGGQAVGCGNGGCNAGPDACCTDPSGSFQTCMEPAQGTLTCAAGTLPCSGDSSHPGGCCPAGNSCAGPGLCCPPGDAACGSGCCPAGQCTAGVCAAAPSVCSPACPTGTTCNDGYCIVAQPSPTVCGNGTPCGSVCCPSGESCVNGTCAYATITATCPDNLPSQCGPAGPCCRAGFTCFGNAGPGPSGFYCVGPGTAHQGPPGPSCGTQSACGAGLTCSAQTCCPPAQPEACGSTCCPSGCTGTTCACPAQLPVNCGAECCSAGALCVQGRCAAACAGGGPACGSECCASGIACQGGVCTCPADHPTPCGDFCCLAGASCAAGACGCPDGRVSCGDSCCGSGRVCQSGVCEDAPSTSGGSCSGGQLGSVNFCIQNGASGGCACNNQSTSLCITPGLWQQNFGGAFPPACAPQGANCVGSDGTTIIAYCCPGLTCLGIGGPGCGPGQGTCQVH
jgi:hypothetical protein